MGEIDISTQQPDWASLPTDILSLVFQKLFQANENSQWPLKQAFSQLVAIQLTCRQWSQALTNNVPPLHLSISNAPSSILRNFIPKWPVQTLTAVVSQTIEFNKLQIQCSGNEASTSSDHTLDVQEEEWLPDCISVDFTALSAHKIDLNIGALTKLKALVLECPSLWQKGYCFDATALSSLSQLTSLSVTGFKDFINLDSLPRSIQKLTLGFGGRGYDAEDLASHTISMVPSISSLPNLDTLTVQKCGIIGVALDEVWDQCREVVIDAVFVLAGVPIRSDRGLVTLFERPYREGAYIPPHVLGDWDDVEASNRAADSSIDHLLLGLTHSSKLTVMRFKGYCSNSVKLVPGNPGSLRSSVPWIHSVNSHATMFFFGASGAEFLDRMLDMQGSGKLPLGELSVELGVDGEDLFEIRNHGIAKNVPS